MTRVLVADDHPAFRRGLELMLADVEDVELVGEAETGTRAVELAAELAPDVVLMDLRMPDLDGIEATRQGRPPGPGARGRGAHHVRGRRLRLRRDEGRCARLPAQGSRAGRDRARGPRGGRGRGDLRPRGGRPGDRALLQRRRGRAAAAFPSLTEREREVLEMIAAGKGNATIAHELVISLKTVRNHVSNIFTKLQVPDRSSAIVKARQAGLGGS